MEIVFNDGEEDYKISKMRIIDNGVSIRLVVYAERQPTKTYFLHEEARG